MIRYFFCATAAVSLLAAGLSAQTIRFDTNVGTFDMELNPMGNPNLQAHVDNMIAYVEAGRFNHTIINRINEVNTTNSTPDFVMQMGQKIAHTLTAPANFSSFPDIPTFPPSIVVDEDNDGEIDFDTTGLTNSRTTVSMGLSQQGPNSATSSFFINLNDNSILDPGGQIGEFVPFATIENMATIDLIDALPTTNIPGGGILSSHVPVLENNRIIFIKRAFVLDLSEEMIAAAVANATIFDEIASAELSSVLSDDPPLNDPGGLLIVPSVPEPSTAILAGALALLAITRRR